MYKIAVMGDWDSIYGFGALGLDTYRFDNNNISEAGNTLRKLAEEDYAVIYITEALASAVTDEIEHYRTKLAPAIILIPGVSGNTGKGMSQLSASVVQAVGSDILFGNTDSKQ
jgi:V/A-type H+-transporting ATPase subunit F